MPREPTPIPSPAPFAACSSCRATARSGCAKALASEADALTFDLESAIPRSELGAARKSVRRVLEAADPTSPALFVRVSDARSSEQAGDLAEIVGPGLYGILLPQVVGPEDVVQTDEALTRFEQEAGMPVGGIRIMPLVETANAVRTAFEIASASPRVAYMGGRHVTRRRPRPIARLPLLRKGAGDALLALEGARRRTRSGHRQSDQRPLGGVSTIRKGCSPSPSSPAISATRA